MTDLKTQVRQLIDNHNFSEALDLLKKSSNLDNALQQTVAVCLLKTSQFDAALKAYSALENQTSQNFAFERAYCYYGKRDLESLKKSLEILNTQTTANQRELNLMAQIYYRMEDYDNSVKIYQTILEMNQKQNIQTSEEMLTNVCASYVSSGSVQGGREFVQKYKNTINSSFDFAYNATCSYIDNGQYAEAEQTLQIAEQNCKKQLSEGFSAQDIESDLQDIRVQLAVVYHLQGDTDRALKLYQEASQKKVEESTNAVIGNNMVALKKEHDLFDSFKKLKNATSQTLEQKLPANQKKIIAANRCLLLLHMNKLDQCRELIRVLDEKWPGNENLALCLAAVHFKDKKFQKCEENLEAFIKKYPNESVKVKFGLAQLQLERNNLKGAIGALSSITEFQNQPGVVATLVYLYDQIHDSENAWKVLESFVNRAEKDEKMEKNDKVQLLKAAAEFKFKRKEYKGAAQWLERAFELDSSDKGALAQLVISFSKFDLGRAEKYSQQLPQSFESKQIDPVKLEEPLALIKIRKEEKKEEIPSQKQEEKKKRTRKHPKRISKNADPNKQADPERWIPMKQRSYFKPKKSKNARKQQQGPQKQGAQGNQQVGQSVLAQKKEQIKLEAQAKESKASGAVSQDTKAPPKQTQNSDTPAEAPAKKLAPKSSKANKNKKKKKKGF